MFIQNKYNTWYYTIIRNAQTRNSITPNEKHHILPKSLGGTNDKHNLVELTCREHYICHLLLTKFTAGVAKQKMFYALHRLTNTDKTKIKSSRIYEYLRYNHSSIVSERMTLNNPNKCGRKPTVKQSIAIRKSNSERVWTNESKLKMSKTKTGVSIIMPAFTAEHKNNLSVSRIKKFAALSLSCTWSHSIFGQFTGTVYELVNTFPLCNLNRGELKKIISSKYPGCKSHKGWIQI